MLLESVLQNVLSEKHKNRDRQGLSAIASGMCSTVFHQLIFVRAPNTVRDTFIFCTETFRTHQKFHEFLKMPIYDQSTSDVSKISFQKFSQISDMGTWFNHDKRNECTLHVLHT